MARRERTHDSHGPRVMVDLAQKSKQKWSNQRPQRLPYIVKTQDDRITC